MFKYKGAILQQLCYKFVNGTASEQLLPLSKCRHPLSKVHMLDYRSSVSYLYFSTIISTYFVWVCTVWASNRLKFYTFLHRTPVQSIYLLMSYTNKANQPAFMNFHLPNRNTYCTFASNDFILPKMKGIIIQYPDLQLIQHS
jgi:hypothetical protein